MAGTSSTNVEWLPLFDGKTLQGWHNYGYRSGSSWSVIDGALYLEKAGQEEIEKVDLVTDEVFVDFHLRLEWKISEGGNSGVLFYVQEDPSRYEHTWMSGPEVQLLDNERHPDANIPKRRASDLYDLIESAKATVHPAGTWNQTEIRCDRAKLEICLNGAQVISATLWSEEWQHLISNSKFKTIPAFGTYRAGKIALQDHGDEVWFRNIMIRKL